MQRVRIDRSCALHLIVIRGPHRDLSANFEQFEGEMTRIERVAAAGRTRGAPRSTNQESKCIHT